METTFNQQFKIGDTVYYKSTKNQESICKGKIQEIHCIIRESGTHNFVYLIATNCTSYLIPGMQTYATPEEACKNLK